MSTVAEDRLTITKVRAQNFRSIEYAELEFGHLTVLVGPNASGKSNLLDVLSFLADATRQGLESAITKRGGIDSISRRTQSGRILGPEIGLYYKSHVGELEYIVALARRAKGKYRVKREFARLAPMDSSMEPVEIELSDGRLTKPKLNGIMREDEAPRGTNSPSPNWDTVRRFIEQLGDQHLQLMPPEGSIITPLLGAFQNRRDATFENPIFRLHIALELSKNDLSDSTLYHLFPNSLRDPQKVASSHPLATSGENLASTLKDMIQKKGRFLSDLQEALGFAVPGINGIRVRQAGSYFVIELKHEGDQLAEKGLWFDLSHESDGTIRLLAMLAALFQDPAPPLICLEEPELAIHPGAMAVLADTMKEASLRGQILVATHSPDLINSLPIESIRAVTAEGGSTRVGKIAEHQVKSVRDNLFTPGELHSMEGLQPARAEKSTG